MLDDVVPRIESQFGSLSDIDGDGSLAIVLTPWLSRLQGGHTSIGGMVRSSDYQRMCRPHLKPQRHALPEFVVAERFRAV